MAGTATKTAAKTKADPRAKLEEKLRADASALLDLHATNTLLFRQMDGLEAALKATATELGDSVKEEFPGLGSVGVSPRKDKEFRGNVPEVDPVKWNALPKKEQNALVKNGVVKIVPDWSSANYGRVTVKLFAAA